MEKIKLLIVEDDEGLSFIEKTGLEDIVGGYEVSIANNGKEGLEIWESTHPDVIVADVDMPVMNGLEMVEHIRHCDNHVIIIFTSALTSPKDVQAGYRIGVNNYVKKPFEPEELDAHIKALLRLREAPATNGTTDSYTIGRYVLNVKQTELQDTLTGKITAMTWREANILQVLAENWGKTVRRDMLLERFWHVHDDYFASRSLDVFVNKLRKMISDDDSISIKTIRGVGLRLGKSN